MHTLYEKNSKYVENRKERKREKCPTDLKSKYETLIGV